MIAYRFQNLADHPHHGVLVKDNKPTFAQFLTPEKAKETAPERLTIAHIQTVVSAYYGITAEHMRSRSRNENHVHPRQMAMLLCRELTKASLPDLGKRFGGRHHTTVMHAIHSASERLHRSPNTEFEYETLRGKLAG